MFVIRHRAEWKCPITVEHLLELKQIIDVDGKKDTPEAGRKRAEIVNGGTQEVDEKGKLPESSERGSNMISGMTYDLPGALHCNIVTITELGLTIP